jgi:hypothetical protein
VAEKVAHLVQVAAEDLVGLAAVAANAMVISLPVAVVIKAINLKAAASLHNSYIESFLLSNKKDTSCEVSFCFITT